MGRPSKIVAIGASAGGLHALQIVLGALPAELPVAVVVVQHTDPRHRSKLAEILQRHAAMRVVEVVDGVTAEAGTIYVAPPNFHVTIDEGAVLRLGSGAPVHWVRPSVDVLFSSAAHALGDRVIAVILTGSGVDGAAGIIAVKSEGGTTIAQDRATSEFSSMPDAATTTGAVDHVLPLQAIGPEIAALAKGELTCQKPPTTTQSSKR